MGKLRIIGLSFILVFFLNSCSAQKDINIESREIMSTINSKTTAIETFKAKFAIQVEKGGEESLTKGELIFKKPNKSNMKGSTIVARGRETRSIEQIMVSDGKILWQYMPALRMAMKLHITSKSSPPVGFEVVNPFFGVEPASIVYKGIEKIDEKEFYIFAGKTVGADFVQGRTSAKLFFHISNNLLYRKMAYNDVTGNSTSITYEEIELNMPLSDSDFSLSLPSDVMVQDIYGE